VRLLRDTQVDDFSKAMNHMSLRKKERDPGREKGAMSEGESKPAVGADRTSVLRR